MIASTLLLTDAAPVIHVQQPVFENTYFSFFFRFQKTWLFTFFWNDSEKKRKKSVAKILSSMMLTLLQKKKKVCWMSIGILASNLLDVMGTYRHLSHTVLSCILSCVHTSELSKIFDVGDRDLPVLTSGNWVIKGWVIKWPVKNYVRFYVFFKIQKNMTFYVFLSGWRRFLEHWQQQNRYTIHQQEAQLLLR